MQVVESCASQNALFGIVFWCECVCAVGRRREKKKRRRRDERTVNGEVVKKEKEKKKKGKGRGQQFFCAYVVRKKNRFFHTRGNVPFCLCAFLRRSRVGLSKKYPRSLSQTATTGNGVLFDPNPFLPRPSLAQGSKLSSGYISDTQGMTTL